MKQLKEALYRKISESYGSENPLPPRIWPLVPFVPLYRLIRFINQGYRVLNRKSLDSPVISIGNLSVGGTGKTEFTIWLTRKLVDDGFQPGILKRGQGERSGILTQQNTSDFPVKYGDESVLLSKHFPDVPIGIGADRFRMGTKIEREFPVDLFLLDDGFQHRQLIRDLDIVLLDSLHDLNQWQLPAGPLREPVSALERSDVISFHQRKADSSQLRSQLEEYVSLRPDTLVTHHCYQFQQIERNGKDVTDEMKQKPLQLITTLARPHRLQRFLKKLGFQIKSHHALPDHDRLDSQSLFDIHTPEETLVTEKEWVKLDPSHRKRVGVIISNLIVDEEERLLRECRLTLEETA